MSKRVYGVHINSDYDTLLVEALRVKEMNGTLIQLFVEPHSTNKFNYEQLNIFLKKNNMQCVVHASYTINLATNWDLYSVWIQQFILEIEMAHKVGAFGIVIHMGKQLELSKEQAFNNMFSALLYVHGQTKKYSDVKILLETSTGQGSEICFRIEEFSYFFKKLSHHKNKEIGNRFGICLDSCHIFAAGYDLRNKEVVDMYIDTFEELIGLRYVSLIHLNDSKKDIGSNVDRHENLGKGFIGSDGLKYFSSFFKNLNVPIVLETPGDYHAEEIKNYLV